MKPAALLCNEISFYFPLFLVSFVLGQFFSAFRHCWLSSDVDSNYKAISRASEEGSPRGHQLGGGLPARTHGYCVNALSLMFSTKLNKWPKTFQRNRQSPQSGKINGNEQEK